MTHDTRDGLQDHDMLERARRARVDAEVTAAAGVTRAREREGAAMDYLTLNECPHGVRMISLDHASGGVRLTGLKCCGQWKELQRWPMTSQQLRVAAERCEHASSAAAIREAAR